MTTPKCPLIFNVLAECHVSKARTSRMTLHHGPVDTPVFMPVGTQGTLKGMLSEQLEKLGLQIMLANTYHLGAKPGPEILEKAGGLHKFMNWNGCLLTDSGGFQMVSLLKLAEITEEGVRFQSLNEQKAEVMLTPEHSIEIQNAIGADIIMQLDDVVKTTNPDKARIEESVNRTTRWLDRCLKAHKKPEIQNIFPIVQGTLYEDLREKSANDHIKRDVRGYAIGGLSGGESKDDFWKMVHLSTEILPKDKPRYLMGVGFAEDLVVCCALGVDMFDCVFPTRTARFGCALTRTGQLNLKKEQFKKDFRPIDDNCPCNTYKMLRELTLLVLGAAMVMAQRRLALPDPRSCASRVRHATYRDARGVTHSYFFSWEHPPTRGLEVDWLDARNICRRHCMDAVSLETPQENEFIKQRIARGNIRYIWTSGRKCNFAGCDRADLQPPNINGWFWSGSGAKIGPTTQRNSGDWSATGGYGQPQPDNREAAQGNDESCLSILNNFYNDGIKWHDVACHHIKPFVCEDSEELLNFVASRNPGIRL